ncbi:MAG: hypothetical protein H7Z19_21250, partial [Chitinophagaceae bacterium]|nr:hypothetical protein [Rubrivivax sp.]
MSARKPLDLDVEPDAAASAKSGLPTMIGKYRIKSKLGEGATSEVFLAHDPFRGLDVAIKRVRISLSA